MKILIRVVALFYLLGITAVDARIVPSLTVHVDTNRVDGPDAPKRGVVFTDQSVIVDVTIVLAPVPDEPGVSSPPVSLELPQRQWWKALDWSLRDAKGVLRNVPIESARLVRDDVGPRLRAQAAGSPLRLIGGDRVRATLNVGVLPRGDYSISARYRSLAAPPFLFAVRDGDETADIHRTYLHYRLRHAANYDESRDLTLELAAAEPQNALIFEELASMAVLNGRDADANEFFARTALLIEQNRDVFRKRQPDNREMLQQFDHKVAQLVAVRQALTNYFANRSTLQFEVHVGPGEREYTLVRRATGEVLQRIR